MKILSEKVYAIAFVALLQFLFILGVILWSDTPREILYNLHIIYLVMLSVCAIGTFIAEYKYNILTKNRLYYRMVFAALTLLIIKCVLLLIALITYPEQNEHDVIGDHEYQCSMEETEDETSDLDYILDRYDVVVMDGDKEIYKLQSIDNDVEFIDFD